MKKLKRLSLRIPKMSEEGLKTIGMLKNLEVLVVVDVVNNKGLSYISGLTNLKTLIIYGKFDDEGVKIISELKKLEILALRESEITDEGLSYLRGLERLRELDLRRSNKITDAGLKYIAEIEGFRQAYWEQCKSGQEDHECPQGEIDVSCTGVTEEGAKWLWSELRKNKKGEGDIYVRYECESSE